MNSHKVISTRLLTDNTYILRFERRELQFIPGQHICVGLPNDEDRPYSIYSGITDDYLEILVKVVEKGNVSKKLKLLKPGASIIVGRPHGSFSIPEDLIMDSHFVFIATGTGIAPFHSIIQSYPTISYTLIHGIRSKNEAYESLKYDDKKYITCISRDTTGTFNGRISTFLKQTNVELTNFYYLCGNSDMIDDVFSILSQKGVLRANIKTEMYF